jgi:hypothetical protein
MDYCGYALQGFLHYPLLLPFLIYIHNKLACFEENREKALFLLFVETRLAMFKHTEDPDEIGPYFLWD